MKTTLLCAIAAIAIAITSPSAAQGPPPRLELKLAPHPAATPDEGYIAVEMRMEAPRLAKGEGLVRLPLTLVGIPSARYDGEALQARDDAGPLPLTQDEEPPTPQGVYRRWSVGRATRGDVIVTYHSRSGDADKGKASAIKIFNSSRIDLYNLYIHDMEASYSILLKGRVDQIYTSRQTYTNHTGNEGMTKGGTGDVLAGLAAGFLAQKLSGVQSAINAAYINGKIGDYLKQKKGYSFIASDLINDYQRIVKRL